MFRYSLTSFCESFNKCLKLKCGPNSLAINTRSIKTSSVMKNDGEDQEPLSFAAPRRVKARGFADQVRIFRTLK